MPSEDRLTQFSPPEVLVNDFFRIPTQQAHLDLAGAVEVTLGQPGAPCIADCDNVAILRLFGQTLDGATKDPRVALPHRFLTVRLENDSCF